MAKLIVLFVVAFVDMIGAVMILPLLPFYATTLGASATVVGFLVAAFSLAQLLCAPSWGRMSDRLGRRPAILLGLGITAVSYLLFAYANSLALLFLSRLVQGVGGGTIGVVNAYVTDASPPEQRTKTLGWLTAVTSAGAVGGPALGSLLVNFGPRAPGIGAAALSLMTALFAWRFLRESRSMRHSVPIPIPGVAPATAPGGAAATPPTITSSGGALLHVLTRWREPAPRLIWIYAIAVGAFYGTGPVVPLLFHERFGITAQAMGYIFAYLGGIGVVVRAGILGWIVDRVGEPRLARVGIVVLSAGLCASAMARSWPMLFVGLTLMPLGTAFLFPCILGMLSRLVPSGQRGLYFGVQQTFNGVTRMAFPMAAGILMDAFGKATPFWVAGVMVIAMLPFAAQLGKPAKVEA
ncbi:MAG TPA: MFS transporter [Gemmatimonadales bacterium]|jgi:MFS family permease